MTAAEWLCCTDPMVMLEHLRRSALSDPKFRLFAVVCCRRIWQHLPDERSRRAIDVIERGADGQTTTKELEEAITAAEAAEPAGPLAAVATVLLRAAARAGAMAWSNVEHACSAAAHASPDPAQERCRQANLLRDIVGNPFGPLPAIDPGWLTWHGATIAHLAAAIYQERRFSDLPVLADALEEAGCTNADMLAHCRQPGEHARGCWLMDAILGKS
jgi:hypothetical protein